MPPFVFFLPTNPPQKVTVPDGKKALFNFYDATGQRHLKSRNANESNAELEARIHELEEENRMHEKALHELRKISAATRGSEASSSMSAKCTASSSKSALLLATSSSARPEVSGLHREPSRES